VNQQPPSPCGRLPRRAADRQAHAWAQAEEQRTPRGLLLPRCKTAARRAVGCLATDSANLRRRIRAGRGRAGRGWQDVQYSVASQVRLHTTAVRTAARTADRPRHEQALQGVRGGHKGA
jgi:hypothetical protein